MKQNVTGFTIIIAITRECSSFPHKQRFTLSGSSPAVPPTPAYCDWSENVRWDLELAFPFSPFRGHSVQSLQFFP